jgi:nitroimidazol reductase NimA-like FMN-containing flavoprotein (pyridoxamine 5'-phosphate oxidase superfamily)
MSSNADRIAGRQITKVMPKKELEDHMVNFLKTQNMCVLATCKDNKPRATPIEYYSKGTTLYMVAEEGQKLENIKSNPTVSIGIFAPYTGWLSARGVQITGKAKIITRENASEFKEAMSVYQWEKAVKELGIKELPQAVKVLKIESQKIEIADISLGAKGYAARQVWTQ